MNFLIDHLIAASKASKQTNNIIIFMFFLMLPIANSTIINYNINRMKDVLSAKNELQRFFFFFCW